jgi:hypothetical protein
MVQSGNVTLQQTRPPWNAGFVEIVWVTPDPTKSEVPQRQWTVVPDVETKRDS